MTPPHIEAAAREWRCFHCDEVFTDAEAAAEHFGCILDEPACKLTEQEGGILALLRDAQRQLDEYRNEESSSTRAFYALGAEHSTKLIRAEQEGYDKGLADGRSLARAATLEEAAKVAEWAHMVPPDGGSPSEEECEVAREAAKRIRALSVEG